MANWIGPLDQILRGDATRQSILRQGRIEIPVGRLSIVVIVLAMIYGLCMGSFAVILTAWSPDGVTQDTILQLIASIVKLPLLFFLTLLVTFPWVCSTCSWDHDSQSFLWRGCWSRCSV